MSLKKYKEYKASGIKQLPNVPKDWNINRLANFGSFQKGCGITRKNLTEKGLPAILYGDLYTKYDIVANDIINRISLETSKKSIKVNSGVILFTGSGETLEDIGKSITYIGKKPVFIGGDAIIYKQKEFNSVFLAYTLSSKYATIQKINEAKGNIIFHVYASRLRNLQISYPNYKTQTTIANYLDHKTQAIDKKVALLESKILKYQELRKSIINQAVTKGVKFVNGELLMINDNSKIDNSKFKPSGISWIGNIPEHWEVKRGKEIFNEYGKSKISAKEGDKEGKYKFFTSSSIQSKWLDYYSLNKEALIFSTGGVAGVNYCDKKYSYSTDCWALYSIKVELKYYKYFFKSIIYEIDTIGFKGAGIEHLQKDFINQGFVPVFSNEEQISIIEYLDHKTSTIDKITENIKSQINTLKELRKTLINDVVTGKIMVNG